MKLLTRGDINFGVSNSAKKDRAKRKVMKYNQHNDVLMFHNLVVPILEERESIVHVIHNEIGHFSEQQIFAKVKKGTSSIIKLNLSKRQLEHVSIAKW